MGSPLGGLAESRSASRGSIPLGSTTSDQVYKKKSPAMRGSFSKYLAESRSTGIITETSQFCKRDTTSNL